MPFFSELNRCESRSQTSTLDDRDLNVLPLSFFHSWVVKTKLSPRTQEFVTSPVLSQQPRDPSVLPPAALVFLCFIDLRVRKIGKEASSCPRIVSRAPRFYYVATSPDPVGPSLICITCFVLFGWAAIPLALPSRWERIRVVRSNKVARRHSRNGWQTLSFCQGFLSFLGVKTPTNHLHPTSVTQEIVPDRCPPWLLYDGDPLVSKNGLQCLWASLLSQTLFFLWVTFVCCVALFEWLEDGED